jgi:hypothetical protein
MWVLPRYPALRLARLGANHFKHISTLHDTTFEPRRRTTSFSNAKIYFKTFLNLSTSMLDYHIAGSHFDTLLIPVPMKHFSPPIFPGRSRSVAWPHREFLKRSKGTPIHDGYPYMTQSCHCKTLSNVTCGPRFTNHSNFMRNCCSQLKPVWSPRRLRRISSEPRQIALNK